MTSRLISGKIVEMMNTRTTASSVFATPRSVHRVSNGVSTTAQDYVAVEAPLEVWIGGSPATIMMRTPGHDEELVRGFLFNEGMITSMDDIISIAPIAGSDRGGDTIGGSVIAVELAPTATPKMERLFYSNSSCGVCGKQTIASLEIRGTPAGTGFQMSRKILAGLPDQLRDAQGTFAQTGGVHASGLFTSAGDLIVVREDVGRHNAFDKISGWALAAGRIPLSDCALLLSGRVSYELAQKAVAAGIPLIAAVGAPSSLAVEIAERFGITLAGFLRPSSMNIYARPERIVD